MVTRNPQPKPLPGPAVQKVGPRTPKATTVRLDPQVRAGLDLLQKSTHRPVNKLVNEALAEFIHKCAADLESSLEETLSRVKAYRRADPGFRRSIAAFAQAEAAFAADDPVEGKVVAAAKGSAVAKVREILRG